MKLEKKVDSELDIDLKIPLTCHINCVGGITGTVPVAKINYNVNAPEKMPHKLHGWYNGSSPVFKSKQDANCSLPMCCENCVCGMLEGGMSKCNAYATVWRYEHENFRGRPEYNTIQPAETCRDQREDRLLATIRRHVTLGSGFVLDCPWLRGQEKLWGVGNSQN